MVFSDLLRDNKKMLKRLSFESDSVQNSDFCLDL